MSTIVSSTPCSLCLRDIVGLHIRCGECDNVDLCSTCFLLGKESPVVSAHRRGHAYRVIQNLNTLSLVSEIVAPSLAGSGGSSSSSSSSRSGPEWNAREELMLLDGIKLYGLGNWREVANYLGTRSETACARHYISAYLSGPTAPLPHFKTGDGTSRSSIGNASAANAPLTPSTLQLSVSNATSAASIPASLSSALAATVATLPSSSPFSSNADAQMVGGSTSSSCSSASSASSSSQSIHAQASATVPSATPATSSSAASLAHVPKAEIQGYLPLRGDFDVEHDNEAEAILGDLEFVEGEHATETELKLRIMAIYNSKLDERERRKAFVIERGLLEYKRLHAIEKKRSPEEKEVYEALRPLSRFMTPEESEALAKGLITEHRLRARIAALQEYRRAGVSSLVEAQDYEAAKRKRGGGGVAGSLLGDAAAAAAAGGGGGGG